VTDCFFLLVDVFRLHVTLL